MYHGRNPRTIDYINPGQANELPALHWAHNEGVTCAAITRDGNDCTRKATHYAKARYPLCKTHGTSAYVIDVRKA